MKKWAFFIGKFLLLPFCVFADIDPDRFYKLDKSLFQNAQPFFKNPSHPKLGSDKAPLRVYVFQDYQCHHCVIAHEERQKLKSTLQEKIQWVFVEYPFMGPLSVMAAQAALFANQVHQYEALQKALFQQKGELSEEKIYRALKTLGIKRKDFRKAIEQKSFLPYLDANEKQGFAFHIESTPTFIINNQVIKGVLEEQDLETFIRK